MFYFTESLPLMLMALALSMDAFSVSLGLGMQNLRLRKILFIGLLFGFFHMAFPIFGLVLGRYLSDEFGQVTLMISGLVLIFVGFHMFYSAFSVHKSKPLFHSSNLSIFLLAITVSIDSAPVGLSLGIAGVRTAIALLFFGSFTALFTWTGLLIGRKVKGFLNAYSELLGGSILLSFGLYILFFS